MRRIEELLEKKWSAPLSAAEMVATGFAVPIVGPTFGGTGAYRELSAAYGYTPGAAVGGTTAFVR
jgi:hypothetical protein